MLENSPLTVYDVVVIVFYFILILGIGFYSFFKGNRSTVSGYFLAGRYMIWLTVGGSLFASNIGSEHFVGLAGSGASSGIGVAAFEFNAAIVLQLLGSLFLPVYIASGANTLPEYMKKRFGGTRIRTYLSCLYILLYIFAKISVDLYSGALFIERGLNWNMYSSIFFILFMTVICTITGGLTAVMYTDTVQTFLILIGAAVTAVISVRKVGGLNSLRYKYMNAIPSNLEHRSRTNYFAYSASNNLQSTLHNNISLMENAKGCGLPRLDSWVILRNAWNSDVPWLGIVLGQTTVSLWYWCTDQMMVQRALAAKSLSHAQGGTIFVGYLKLLPLFLLIIPGMASRVLYTDLVACSDPDKCQKICGNRVSCANIAYPLMAFDILPPGLKGVMFSVMLAALMSDLASVFNSSSTLFTIDIWQKVRRKASVKELMIVGRCFVLVMVAASVAWIPVIESFQGGQLYIYIQSVGSYLAPPIACVFLLAVLWPRCNEQGAFWSLMIGLVIGLIRMLLDLLYRDPGCGKPDTRPPVVGKLHFLYFAAILFWITAFLCFTISKLTKPPPKKYLIRTTYWTRFAIPPTTVPDENTNLGQQRENLLCSLNENNNDINNHNNSNYKRDRKMLNHLSAVDENQSTTSNGRVVLDDERNMVIGQTHNKFITPPEGTNNNNKDIDFDTKTAATTVLPLRNILKTMPGSENATESAAPVAQASNSKKSRSTPSSNNNNNSWMLMAPRVKRIWNWFLGFEAEEMHWSTEFSAEDITDQESLRRDLALKRAQVEEIKRTIQAQRMEKIQSLHQTPLVTFFIKLNVILIVSLAVFLMLYFSF